MPRANPGEVWIVRLQRRIGELTDEELRLVRSKLCELLHFAPEGGAR